MIDELIKILREELQSMAATQSIFYNHSWWAEDDMEEFLTHLKKKYAIVLEGEK